MWLEAITDNLFLLDGYNVLEDQTGAKFISGLHEHCGMGICIAEFHFCNEVRKTMLQYVLWECIRITGCFQTYGRHLYLTVGLLYKTSETIFEFRVFLFFQMGYGRM